MEEHAIGEPLSPLVMEFLAWVSSRPRSYAEAMEAWRTSCPRHSVWEDALIDGLVRVERAGTMDRAKVVLTARGRAILAGNSEAPR
jgi:hypothetical protein